MADVPAWLLVLQTVAAGGVGLAGSFIVPRAQREAKKAEQVAAAHTIMRNQAERIFNLLADLRAQNAQTQERVIRGLLGNHAGEFGSPDSEELRRLDGLHGPLASYYPGALPILHAALTERQERISVLSAEILTIEGGIGSPAGLHLRLRIAGAGADVNSKCLHEITRFMLEAVKPYAPTVAI